MDGSPIALVNARLSGVEQAPAPLGTYILARHLILLEAEREEFRARVPVALVVPPILQLPDEPPGFGWKVPPPPIEMLTHQVLPFFVCARQEDSGKQTEALANLVWSGSSWSTHFPRQLAGPAGVQTSEPLPAGAVVQLHSHAQMKPFWSSTDNADEQGFLIYGVVGRIGAPAPQLLLRVGINGHWLPLRWNDVFRS
jgi:hypothetical protein